MSEVSVKNLNSVPWFIAIMSSNSGALSIIPQALVITRTVPESVTDTKQINWFEQQIPGGKTSVLKFGSFGSRNISFTIRMANFNDDIGITPTIAALNPLRVPNAFFSIDPDPFTGPPPVVFYHSAAALTPQYYKVRDLSYTTSYPNKIGKPQVLDASFQLTLDESTKLYRYLEQISMKALQVIGTAQSITRAFGSSNPYKKSGFF